MSVRTKYAYFSISVTEMPPARCWTACNRLDGFYQHKKDRDLFEAANDDKPGLVQRCFLFSADILS